jgi:hypothetical protein
MDSTKKMMLDMTMMTMEGRIPIKRCLIDLDMIFHCVIKIERCKILVVLCNALYLYLLDIFFVVVVIMSLL